MIDVEGMSQLLASLEEYAIKTTSEVRQAVKDSAQDALDFAVALTPVSPDGSHGNPPGFLRAGNAIRPVSELATLEQWELYNPVFYAGFVIFGTYKMRAQDFFTPAFAVGRRNLQSRLESIAAR